MYLILNKNHNTTEEFSSSHRVIIEKVVSHMLRDYRVNSLRESLYSETRMFTKIGGDWCFIEVSYDICNYEELTLDNCEIETESLEEYFGKEGAEVFLKEIEYMTICVLDEEAIEKFTIIY